MKSAIIFLTIVSLFFSWWFLGGINLAELKYTGLEKAKEICGNSTIIEQGYQRNIFSGFGGRRWYQCEKNNITWQFAITRRLNSAEPQVYSLQQMNTFPTSFNIKN